MGERVCIKETVRGECPGATERRARDLPQQVGHPSSPAMILYHSMSFCGAWLQNPSGGNGGLKACAAIGVAKTTAVITSSLIFMVVTSCQSA